jgi:hypothetical protein
MGKLKQQLVDLDKLDTNFVLHHYGEFLVSCMKDHSIPNTWNDAISAVHRCAYVAGGRLSRVQIEYILTENIESLYEE